MKSISKRIIKIIKEAIHPKIQEKFWIESYGAIDIDPKHLVIWICVLTDTTKNSLRDDVELIKTIKQILLENDYPKNAIPDVFIGFESQESVDRESNGDWYLHFK